MLRKLFLGLLFIAALAGISRALVSLPAIQNPLIERVIAKRMYSVPNDLFVDDALRVTLCGSAAPTPIRNRAAACVMVIAGGKFYIVDTGNRSTNNLGLWRVPADKIGGVLLTHFHSDHIGDLGELNMMTWSQGRPSALNVYGPVGVKRVVNGFSEAYALSRGYRTAHHGEQYLNSSKGQMIAKEVPLNGDSAVVLEESGLKITMFAVDHAPINPAVGYRFDYKGRSVVISGDTKQTQRVTDAAKNADVLIHEALAKHIVTAMADASRKIKNQQLGTVLDDILDYHASPVEAAEVANDANAKMLVLYHLVPAPPNKIAEIVFMRGVKAVRSSGVILGYDGLTLTLPAGSDDILEENLDRRI